MDDLFESRDSGAIDLARRLEAFAEARLTPSVASTTVLRGTVMAAAHRRAALLAAEGPAASPVIARQAVDLEGPRMGLRWRRPAVALLAAGLTVGVLAGTAFAAQPAGLLYDARIGIEMATLPGGSMARVEAEVGRLEQRLAEAQQASARGDQTALAAALEAYAAIVAEAGAGSDGDPAASALLEAAIMRHVAILTALVGEVPATAQSAIQHALSSSSTVLDDIDRATPGTNGANPDGNGTPSGPGANQGGNGAPGGPGAIPGSNEAPVAPAAEPTAKPPKATPERPDRTPRPKPTHGGQPDARDEAPADEPTTHSRSSGSQ